MVIFHSYLVILVITRWYLSASLCLLSKGQWAWPAEPLEPPRLPPPRPRQTKPSPTPRASEKNSPFGIQNFPRNLGVPTNTANFTGHCWIVLSALGFTNQLMINFGSMEADPVRGIPIDDPAELWNPRGELSKSANLQNANANHHGRSYTAKTRIIFTCSWV